MIAGDGSDFASVSGLQITSRPGPADWPGGSSFQSVHFRSRFRSAGAGCPGDLWSGARGCAWMFFVVAYVSGCFVVCCHYKSQSTPGQAVDL